MERRRTSSFDCFNALPALMMQPNKGHNLEDGFQESSGKWLGSLLLCYSFIHSLAHFLLMNVSITMSLFIFLHLATYLYLVNKWNEETERLSVAIVDSCSLWCPSRSTIPLDGLEQAVEHTLSKGANDWTELSKPYPDDYSLPTARNQGSSVEVS